MGRRGRNRRPDSGVSGAVVIDKPPGCTSHDVVDRVRTSLGTRRVGHAGTLDPDATGVLVVGVGLGTKLLQFISGSDKTYTGEVIFGVETSTLDAAGEVTATHDMIGLGPDQVVAAAAGFVGEIQQIPPMVSAVRVDGKRLHELARRGIEVERQARSVTVHRFDVEATNDPLVYRLAVSCSSGTYIRALAADLGTALGGGAHLRSLRRTSVGTITIEQAQPVDNFELQPIDLLLGSMPVLHVDHAVAERVSHGRKLPTGHSGGGEPRSAASDPGFVAVKGPDDILLAVYQARSGELCPVKVLVGR
ncbi:MAG: tRNA pseudouridine(55) synthase TruB [Acidimicrobiia bacterium]|nr:tRNA pseudouridine(55) synthase TruB [Acidimicrobiia bacterium]